jgi:ABC-type cobalamin/Fe3+-siderophores transport system ATPase subunit
MELKNISWEANGSSIISNINYRFDSGKTYLIIGPNGAGKSSLLNIVAGLIVPTSGNLSWFDNEHWSLANAHNRAFLLQKNERVIQLKAHDIAVSYTHLRAHETG